MTRPLRVLQIVEATFDGVGRHVLDLCAHLLSQGHVVDLAWSPDRSEPRFVRGVESLPLHHAIRLSSGSSSWKATRRVGRDIGRFASEHGPYDIVHGHSSRGGAWARLFVDGGARIYTPNALITQALEIGESRRVAFAMVERLLSYRTDGLIFVSPEEEAHAASIGLRPQHSIVIPNGIPLGDLPSKRDARQELGLEQDSFVFGTVGRLASQKGHDLLIRAFAAYTRNGPGELVIVGEGPEDGNLRLLAADLGVENRVRFLGRRPGQEAMMAFDSFVLASRYEGFPYVVLEAMWAGLPIVLSRSASASSLVVDGQNGILAEAESDEFCGAMKRVYQDEGLRNRLASKAKVSVGEYSTQSMVVSTESFYRSVLG